MTTITFKIDAKRKARIENLLLQRGQTFEQFLEPWLADADTHMGHDPADDQEDQDSAAERFTKKATRAEADRRAKSRQETARANTDKLATDSILEEVVKPR